MVTRLFGPRFVLVLLLGLSLLAAPGAGAVTTTSVPGAVDRSSRSAVVTAYKEQLLPALNTPVGWSGGSVANCSAGTESAASRQATIDAVNYYRSMVGLPRVTNNTDTATSWNAKAQKAALIMHANGPYYPGNPHEPTEWWNCYTPGGAEAAGASNLAYGNAGAKAVEAYITDTGANNAAVGHRRWLLFPPLARIGTGSTSKANALWVIDDVAQPRPLAADVGWVAWPPAGYIPWETLPHQEAATKLFRWSLSSNRLPAANYDSAEVSMTFGAEQLHVVQEMTENSLAGYAGDTTLVWSATRSNGKRFPIEGDATFTVTVTGIRDGEVTLEPLVYTVNAVRAVPDTTAPPKIDFVEPTGTLRGVQLAWHNPWQVDDLKGVEVRARKGTTAPSRTEGTRVCIGLREACTATRLDANASYTFSTFTFDYAGNYSARNVARVQGMTLTIAAPDRIRRGATAKIAGTLYYDRVKNIIEPDAPVFLQSRTRRADGTWGAWQDSGVTVTGSSGNQWGRYAFAKSPSRTTQYRVRYAGDRWQNRAVSATRTVRVG